MKFKIYTLPLLMILILGNFSLQAQTQSPLEQALQYVEDNQVEWNFTHTDTRELTVRDLYPSSSGIYHVILQQNYKGIEINNATLNVTITPKGQVYAVGKPRFFQDLKSKINTTKATLTPAQAIEFAIGHTSKPDQQVPRMEEQINEQSFVFNKGAISHDEIPVDLKYRVNNAGEIILSWRVVINEVGKSDWWEMYIDANTGELVYKFNYTVSCRFHDDAFHHHDLACVDAPERPALKTNNKKNTSAAANSYRVFPFPGESPAHTDHQIVTDPADPVASPFGWHDTNGIDGPEYTITRGNNVHAYQDHNNNGFPSNDEPDGGADLEFDFPYDVNAGPLSYTDAATVNLFYAVNSIHDFTYHYGFDEAAGNFQTKNYTSMGSGNDHVIAQSQDGYPDSLNNANFRTPQDGFSGVMQMYVWDRNVGFGEKFLQVLEPASIAGSYGAISSAGGSSGYGPPPPAIPIEAEVVEVLDVAYDPFNTDACEEILNADDLKNKIALIDRGGCDFEFKSKNAEAAGAIAVIICNFEDEPVGMAGVPGIDPTIPTIMIGRPDCQTIRTFAGSGLKVTIGEPSNTGPDFLDGDFDNGIIAHEFSHGISTRLTGGPGSNVCLFNAENMGEGWSDFFGLVMTVRPGDTGEMRRGVGTFVNRQPNDAKGIRTYPYSTDMNINPLTYADVAGNPETHAVGTVWCSMIWDLYWEMVKEYNFDPDLVTGTGGNNMAVHLVMEGMKQQQCSPGFEEGRDAILAADLALYNGVNDCLIKRVFARRGVGVDAEEVDPNSASDQVVDFRVDPFCSKLLEVTKAVTATVNAGDIIDVTVIVHNYRDETVTGIVVAEELLDGLSYVNGSGSVTGEVQGDMLLFEVGDLEFDTRVKLTYQLATTIDKASISQLYYNCEGTSGWLPESPAENPTDWKNSTDSPHTGNRSWRVDVLGEETKQRVFMQNSIEVSGTKPVVRFFHSYRTEAGLDGGITQVSIDQEAEIWFDTKDLFLREGYSGPLDYGTFVIPNQSAYSGNSNGFIESYIDLSPYLGEDLRLRFNFATDGGNGPTSPNGGFWSFDDVEFLDMFNYDGEVIVTSDQGDNITERAGGLGTVVLGGNVSTTDLDASSLKLQIFPNPAHDWINVKVSSKESTDLQLSVVTLDGKQVLSQNAKVDDTAQHVQIDIGGLAPGFYFIKATTGNATQVEKIVIE